MTNSISFSIQYSFNDVYDFHKLDYDISDRFKATCLNSTYIAPRNLYLLSQKNASILGRSNVILNENNQAALDSLTFSIGIDKIFGVNHDDFDLNDQTNPKFNYSKEVLIDEGIFIGSNINIGHWIFNHLLKVIFLPNDLKNLPLLISDNNIPNRYLDFFDLIGFKNNKKIFLKERTTYRVSNLYMPMMPWHSVQSGFVYFVPECINFLRDFTTKNLLPNHNYYISRKNAKHRLFLNEVEAIESLVDFNFKTIYLEDLSLTEQINLGSNAKNVLCPFGAGTNFFIFMNPGSNMIQLSGRPLMNVTPKFCTFSGINFHNIPSTLSDPNNQLDSDFSIDIDTLYKSISQIVNAK